MEQAEQDIPADLADGSERNRRAYSRASYADRACSAPSGAATWRAIMGYRWEVGMTDMLIRDVPDDVVAAVDARAARLGLSRSEYVRRRLAQDAAAAGSAVSTGDLARFADVFSDLADPDVMSQAWR
jgi:hypothetical protein